MKKVIVLLANGFEEIEAISVIDILRRSSDVIVQICSIDKEYVTGAHGIVIKSDVRIDYIDLYTDTYDLIYIPGGMPGAASLRDNEKVQELLKWHHKEETKMAAICAGPIALEAAGILKGEKGTSFPGFEDQLSYDKYVKEPVVVSGNIITSRGAGTSMELGFVILEELGLKEESERLREEMQYNFLKDSIK
ncbi:MAG: DJ-1/PfpI family protein [Clostridium sp.]|nr:DJ-1/PfpI family protein [Clostridium sp.]